MDDQFLIGLGYLGVTARLKRLSEKLTGEIKELYRQEGLDIEPSWHLVFLLLTDRQKLSMSEVASTLNLSQPAATKMVGRMVDRNYLKVIEGVGDKRKRSVKLTAKAKRNFPRFEQVWAAGQEAIKELIQVNPEFMESLRQFEAELFQKSFDQRASEFLHSDRKKDSK